MHAPNQHTAHAAKAVNGEKLKMLINCFAK